MNSGPCIVAGNAWCLFEDLDRAWKLYPDIPVIAVNGAARNVKAIGLYSMHPDRFISHRWIHWQKKKHNGFIVHSSKYQENMPWVDYWWDKSIGGGGSAWGARKVASLIGFDSVILCGCPLETGPYVEGHSMGGLMQHEHVIRDLQDQILEDVEWHDNVSSMSGFTRKLFGEPC